MPLWKWNTGSGPTPGGETGGNDWQNGSVEGWASSAAARGAGAIWWGTGSRQRGSSQPTDGRLNPGFSSRWRDGLTAFDPLLETLAAVQKSAHLLISYDGFTHCRTHPFHHGYDLCGGARPRSVFQAVDARCSSVRSRPEIACEDELTHDVYSRSVSSDFCHQSSYIGNSFSVLRSRQVFCLRRMSLHDVDLLTSKCLFSQEST
jgi:hypothetical protein